MWKDSFEPDTWNDSFEPAAFKIIQKVLAFTDTFSLNQFFKNTLSEKQLYFPMHSLKYIILVIKSVLSPPKVL